MSFEAHNTSHDKPLLFVDVDGVISLFGFDPAAAISDPGDVYVVDDVAHVMAPRVGKRLAHLAERFELVWATGWEEKANEHLPQVLGLPFSRLHSLDFGGRAVFGSSDWKVDAVAAYAGDRPAAWIDDNLGELPRMWAFSRAAPTMLVETRCDEGLTNEHLVALLEWADAVAALPAVQRARAEVA